MSELKEAITYFEQLLHRFEDAPDETYWGKEHNATTRKMIGIAIDALRRAQPENEPLTCDEMNALDHEPIYVLHTGGKWTMNGWHIATASSYQNHGRCDLEIDNGNTIIDMQNYGNTWLAYRRKPKEEI